MIFEGIVAQVLDMDYSPAPVVVNSKRIYLNLSHDGKDDIDDLREVKLVNSMKMQTNTMLSISCYQLTELGARMLMEGEGVGEELAARLVAAKDAVDTFTLDEDLCRIEAEWDEENNKPFHILTLNFTLTLNVTLTLTLIVGESALSHRE